MYLPKTHSEWKEFVNKLVNLYTWYVKEVKANLLAAVGEMSKNVLITFDKLNKLERVSGATSHAHCTDIFKCKFHYALTG